MTVTSILSIKQYTGNASTTAFSFPYKAFNTTDFIVTILNTSTLVVTTQVNGGAGTYDYTVAVAADKNSATITFSNAPLSAHKVTIERKMSLTQTTDYTPNDNFPAETHEQALDERTLMVQQVQNSYENNSFRFDKNVTDAGIVEINKTVAERGNKVLSFNAAGALIATQEIGTFLGNWGAATVYAVRDLIKDTSNNNIYICNTAHTSSGSQPISTNTDVAKWTLIVDAASATTSATAAAASATTATAQAVIATAKAVLTASDAVDTAADLVETAADVVAAEAAKNSAETAYDNFDDRYLGQKSSDPSVDNDGASLLTGALYFNTSNNVMMAYTGSAWVRTTPTSSDQTNINTLSAAAVITDMSILATAAIVADMAILGTADVVTDMNVLATADVVTDMNVLGTADVVTDMNVLGTADVVADMNTLGTADVVTDMNVLGTSGNVVNMNTLSGISANITTVAGISANVTTVASISANVTSVANNEANVNRYGDEYTIASSAPGSPSEGDLWYDSTNNVLKVHNGSSFVAVTSSTAGITDVVDDSTPELGGDLGLNGNSIDFPTTPNISDCLDEDNMSSNSATKLATQQSIKAYVDASATSPEVYGFSVDANGHLIVTTTNSGADNITSTTYATFKDTLLSVAGYSWSLVGTQLRATI